MALCVRIEALVPRILIHNSESLSYLASPFWVLVEDMMGYVVRKVEDISLTFLVRF